MQDFVCSPASFSLGKMPRRGMVGSSGEYYKAFVPSSIQKVLCPVIGRWIFPMPMLIVTDLKMPGDPLLLLELSSMQVRPWLLTLATLVSPVGGCTFSARGFCQVLLGSFLGLHLQTLKMGSWGNGTHFIYVLYLGDHSPLLPYTLYLANHCFID